MFVHFISHSTAQTTKHVFLEQQVDRGLEAIAYDLELTDDPEEATEEHAAEVPLHSLGESEGGVHEHTMPLALIVEGGGPGEVRQTTVETRCD